MTLCRSFGYSKQAYYRSQRFGAMSVSVTSWAWWRNCATTCRAWAE